MALDEARVDARVRSWGMAGERALRLLALGTLVTGFVLIVLGAIVRIEGAGMGCGDDWPVCNGEVVPTFSYLTTIEYLHRAVAGVVLLLTGGLVWASRGVVGRRVRGLAVTALLLVLAQAGLGAVTVFVELNPKAVTAHLGMAQAYLAVVIAIVLIVTGAGRRSWIAGATRSIALPAMVAAGATFALLLSGAYTASSGAAWACPAWPGCQGRIVPTGTTPVDIHLLHRWLALVALAAVAITAVRAVGTARARHASIALALMGVEIVAGGANIWFELADWVRVLHLAIATLVWSALVALVVLDRLDKRVADAAATRERLRVLPAVSGD